ncbi:hypothetical protein CC79DRAFT_1361967 [Sarocladium strictum]
MSDLQDAPSGDFQDDSYVSRQGNKNEPLPVQSDADRVEDPVDGDVADSDEQLERDDSDAIDESNIIDERTRHAKPTDTYREPGDDEGLPGPEDGTSSTS